MTLEEKVAQLGSRWVFDHEWEAASGDVSEHHVAPVSAMASADSVADLATTHPHGLGQLTRVYGSFPVSAAEGAAALIRRQRAVISASRLGIPALVHEECLTGFTAYGATVYPCPLAWGATFDPPLVRRMAASIGRDMTGLGIHQGLAPVLDVVRDYRWGRVEECISEDPYLVATIGCSYVEGLESTGLVATLKHFVGYSASRNARNMAPVSMGRREMVEVFLPPFEAAVVRGGARSVMNSYTDIDGVPCAADPWLLTDVLRTQWGFGGTVVADYGSVSMLETAHGTAASPAEAARQALTAGLDVELPDTVCFGRPLFEQVDQGDVDVALIDRAVRRVLRQKIELGLLDDGWTPESSIAPEHEGDLDSAANRQVARELAERSVVLLKVGSSLPLLDPDGNAPGRICVVGPCADDPNTLLGCYAFPNHVLPRYPQLPLGIPVVTPLEALRAELPTAEIRYTQGCAVLGSDRGGFREAVEAAESADVCVAFVGDRAGMFGKGSTGEGCDAEDLELPGVQSALLDVLFATGTPVVVVVVSGRPYALGRIAEHSAGLVQAFLPGVEGGVALAGVLSGRVNPGGRLPVQIPRTATQVSSYLQPQLSGQDSFVSALQVSPQFPFGHGGSYTRFALDAATVGTTSVTTRGQLTLTVQVRNVGSRSGDEVVQVYLRDPVAQVVRPLLQLIGFARVSLQPGQRADVSFSIHADRFSYPLPDLRRIVEAGLVELMVGTSAADLPYRIAIEVTGPTRVVGSDRCLDTPVHTTLVADDSAK